MRVDNAAATCTEVRTTAATAIAIARPLACVVFALAAISDMATTVHTAQATDSSACLPRLLGLGVGSGPCRLGPFML